MYPTPSQPSQSPLLSLNSFTAATNFVSIYVVDSVGTAAPVLVGERQHQEAMQKVSFVWQGKVCHNMYQGKTSKLKQVDLSTILSEVEEEKNHCKVCSCCTALGPTVS